MSLLDWKMVCHFAGFVKTTVDLPDDLVQRIKIRAVQDRKPLKRFVADLLARGLESPPVTGRAEAMRLPENIVINEQGFPVFRCGTKATTGHLTAEELVALEQKIIEEEDLRRAGITS
jgi:hypothetical protein